MRASVPIDCCDIDRGVSETNKARLDVSGDDDALSGMMDCGGLFEVANPDNFITSLSGEDAEISSSFQPAHRVNYDIEENALH